MDFIIPQIPPTSQNLSSDLKEKINSKTKPLGSLGLLEDLALQVGCIQDTLTPHLSSPHIVVFAGDHGIVQEGVSAYPSEVTHQMVLNFLSGGAGINVFCRQHGIKIKVADAGVDFDFPPHEDLLAVKVRKGTRNFAQEPAMTRAECRQALLAGMDVVKNIHKTGCNVIGFGEMGIGNTSAASMLMSIICERPLEQCVGHGTGLTPPQWQHKFDVLQKARRKYDIDKKDTHEILRTFGGFELAMMAGAMLQAAQYRMVILVDGFIATAAFLMAYAFNPNIKPYAVFCHQSNEHGHKYMLEHLGVKPILNLNLRLGEGTGAALAYPLVVSAVTFLDEMASFTSAGVSKKNI